MEAIEPLIDETSFEKTQKVVAEFRSGVGKSLDAKLRTRDADRRHTSYISDPWFEMYLANRSPVFINGNPFLMFQDDPNLPKENAQTVRAASLVWSSLKFYQLLQSKKLEPEVFHTKPELSKSNWWPSAMKLLPESVSWYGAFLTGAYPLDMSQFRRLFASSRIPRTHVDELTEPFPSVEENPHIVVASRGKFYTLYVKSATPASIRAALDQIIADSATSAPPPNARVGTMTTVERQQWALVREALSQDNAEQLRAIDSALFVLCLDDTEPDSLESANRRLLCDGFDNRWYDKCFQLIVTPSGTAGLNFEHSWGDGVAVMRYFNDVFADSQDHVQAAAASAASPATLRPINWNLSRAIGSSITQARKAAETAASEVHLKINIFDAFGKRYFKKARVSPDAAVQMAFQLAYYRMHGQVVPTYESASTSGYRFGRTETIRTVSKQSVQFVRAMTDEASGDLSARRQLLLSACQVHANRTLAALTGQGFDRHLFALRALAKESNLPTPSIFEDPSYARINHNILSTSTLVSDACRGGGFGPVVPDGYGLGYGVFDDIIGLQISYFSTHVSPLLSLSQTNVATDADVLISHIHRALSEISALLDCRRIN